MLGFCPEAETVFGSDPFWETSRLHPRGTFREFLGTVSHLRRERYDAALILSTEWRRSLFCRKAGIPRRVGFDRRKSQFFLTQLVPFPKEEGKSIHVLEEHQQLLAAFLGRPVEDLR